MSAADQPIVFTQEDADHAEIILKAINAIPNKSAGATVLAVSWLFDQDPELKSAVDFVSRSGWTLK
jgi:hypothetical protein